MSSRNPTTPPATSAPPATIPSRIFRTSKSINTATSTPHAITPYTATGCTRNPALSGVTIPHGSRVGIPTSDPSKNLPTLNIAANTAAQGAQASITFSSGSRFHRRYATTTAAVSNIPPYVNEGSDNSATGARTSACTSPAISSNRETTKAAITPNNPASQSDSPATPTSRAVFKLSHSAATSPTAAQTPYIGRRNGPTRNTRGTKIVAV